MTGTAGTGSARGTGAWIRRNALSLVILVFTIALTVVLVLLQDELKRFASWGYPGAFLIGLASNAPIGVPMPLLILLVPMASVSNPVIIGVAGGFGGAVGELTAYAAGYAGRFVWPDSKGYVRAKSWVKRWGFTVIVLVGLAPLPLDPFGLVVGSLRLPAWKYFAACLPGKIVKCLGLAFFGAWGLNAVLHDPDIRSGLVAAVVGAAATAVLLVLALFLERWTWMKLRQ